MRSIPCWVRVSVSSFHPSIPNKRFQRVASTISSTDLLGCALDYRLTELGTFTGISLKINIHLLHWEH